MDWALARGADAVRTGLEDNIRVQGPAREEHVELVRIAGCADRAAPPAASPTR